MSSTFKPKEVLREALASEKAGNHKVASQLFATLAQYLRKKEKLVEAFSTIERAIRLSPESARLYVQKALIANLLGKESEAVNAMKDFSQIALQKKRVGEYGEYMEEQLTDQPALRSVFYESLLEIERTSSVAFLGLARALKDQLNFSRAQTILLSALQTKDQRLTVIQELKDILTQQKFHEAVDFLEKFERGDLSYEDLALLLGAPPSKKKKEQTTQLAVEREKTLKSLIADLEKELGIPLDEEHDKVEPLVKEFRRRSEAILGEDTRARLDMALAFFEMGLYEDAVDTVNKLPTEDPLYLEAQGLIAHIHLTEGSLLTALETYQNALRNEKLSEEQRKEFLYQMVDIYRRLGDAKMALEVVGRLEKVTPDYRDTHQIKIALQESLVKR